MNKKKFVTKEMNDKQKRPVARVLDVQESTHRN